jgi:hypothetical protein
MICHFSEFAAKITYFEVRLSPGQQEETMNNGSIFVVGAKNKCAGMEMI